MQNRLKIKFIFLASTNNIPLLLTFSKNKSKFHFCQEYKIKNISLYLKQPISKTYARQNLR